MPKLTKKVIDNNLPKEKDYIVWDDEIKGFGCRIFLAARKLTYSIIEHLLHVSFLISKLGFMEI